MAALTPPRLARRISALQFRIPVFRRLIASLTAALAGERVNISGGARAGLSIAALDTNLGYRIGTTEPACSSSSSTRLNQETSSTTSVPTLGSLIGSRLVGPSGRTMAVEPLPAAAALLRENIEVNGFAHATVIEAAIGPGPSSGTLKLGRSSLDGRLGDSGADGPTVEIVSIDHGVEELGWPPPNVIKLDVEGAEVSAIEGMQRTASRCRPTLLVEVHWCRDAVLEALGGLNYVAESFGDVDVLAGGNEVHGMLIARPSRAAERAGD